MLDSMNGAAQGAASGASFGPWGALIGAGVGLLKGELIDKPKAEQQNAMNWIALRQSPWTKQAVPSAQALPDSLGSALQGGFQGYQFGKSMQKSQASDNLYENLMRAQQAPAQKYNIGGASFQPPIQVGASAQNSNNAYQPKVSNPYQQYLGVDDFGYGR